MGATARLSYIRIAPRKLRVIANLIRGQKVDQAIHALRFLNKSGSREMFKLLVSAVANAEDTGKGEVDDLVVKTITVDQAATLRRWRPRAHGRATPLLKKSSHVFVELGAPMPPATASGKREALRAGSPPRGE